MNVVSLFNRKHKSKPRTGIVRLMFSHFIVIQTASDVIATYHVNLLESDNETRQQKTLQCVYPDELTRFFLKKKNGFLHFCSSRLQH